MAPAGLSHEDLMNSVMEWRDQDKGQLADLQDNLDHYETLVSRISLELAQVVEVDKKYRFNPTGGGVDPRVHFQRAQAAAQASEREQQDAWQALLAFQEWDVSTALMTLDLTFGVRSLFREIAPNSQTDLTINWHGREVSARVYMRDLLREQQRGVPLPSINSDQTDLDCAVFISSSPVENNLDELVQVKNDPRVLFWTPASLTSAERDLLIDFAAYRSLVAEYRGRDDQQAKEIIGWVQGRLRGQMGAIYKIVPDAYDRGQITALDHKQMDFNCTGELAAILTPLVGQVLDATYESRDLDFAAARTAFNDTNAVNVINGIVKVGEIPHGARPSRDTDAAKDFGFALQIMRRSNDRKLDISECRYTTAIQEWLDDKLGDSTGTVPADSIYKNFTGIGGPDGLNYGLSRRLIQLYLLCLAREAKVRITLAGRNQPVEYIDYTNIEEIPFRTATLAGFDRIQKLQPPEGWDTLAPFAAILLSDESVRNVQQDVEIQQTIQRLLAERMSRTQAISELSGRMDALFSELGQENPAADRLAAWDSFWNRDIEPDAALNYLRYALDDAFGYRVYRDEVVDTGELDDLKTRQGELESIGKFAQYIVRLQAIARFVNQPLPDDPAMGSIADGFAEAHRSLQCLDKLMWNEARLLGDLVDPAERAIDSYRVRYLQLYDDVTAHAEQIRQALLALSSSPHASTLQMLGTVKPLGEDLWPDVERQITAVVEDESAFMPTSLTRQQVDNYLKTLPQPPNCRLTLTNGAEWIDRADVALARGEALLADALGEKARLLQSTALRERLNQAKDQPFIAGLLDSTGEEETIGYLIEKLGQEEAVENAEQLSRALRKVSVRKVYLTDFRPDRRTIEADDVEDVVDDFRQFLASALHANGDESPVIELEYGND